LHAFSLAKFLAAKNNKSEELTQMLQNLLTQLCTELDIQPIPTMNEKKFIPFSMGAMIDIEIRDLEPGMSLFANIGPVSSIRREELFLELMRANYLGQATGSSRIGMSADEKFLTLSLGMPYEMSYRAFREAIEDFTNFLLYWRKEVEKYYKQDTLL
jgi:hypothetical protein